MVKMGRSCWYRSRLADSSKQSHRCGGKLEDSVGLEDCRSRSDGFQHFLAVAEFDSLLRSQIAGSALEICCCVSCVNRVSRNET